MELFFLLKIQYQFSSLSNKINNFINQMEEIKKYRFLVIGKMGEGKSSLCRSLTGNQNIEVSSRIQSCTRQTSSLQSTDEFKDQHKVDIEIIDTPGLDSKQEDLLQIFIDLATTLSKFPEINGILYVVSMANKRDEHMSWFLNFLTLYFSKEQMATSIIPILTNYDKVIFEDDEKIFQAKDSRRQELCGLWGNQKECRFWDNHVCWINEANQKKGIKLQQQFQEIVENQLPSLLSKASLISINCEEKAAQFDDYILKKLQQIAKINKGRYDTIVQQIEPIKIQGKIECLTFLKKISDNNIVRKVAICILALPVPMVFFDKQLSFKEHQIDDNSGKIKAEIKQGVRKLINLKFNSEIKDKIVLTNQEDRPYISFQLFQGDVRGRIKVFSLNSHLIQIEELSVTRIPSEKEPYECKMISDKMGTQNGQIVFEDPGIMLKNDSDEICEYKLHSIKVRRPIDETCQEFIRKVINDVKQFKA